MCSEPEAQWSRSAGSPGGITGIVLILDLASSCVEESWSQVQHQERDRKQVVQLGNNTFTNIGILLLYWIIAKIKTPNTKAQGVIH